MLDVHLFLWMMDVRLFQTIFGTNQMAQKNTIQPCGAINSQGMALVLCLLLMTTLCLVGGAALSVSELNQKIVGNGARQVQALYLAEAGRELALAHLREEPLWRGDESESPHSFSGTLEVNSIPGTFRVVLSDCTADENGIFNALIPAGYVMVESAGTWGDAFQTVSCMARLRPLESSAAAFPNVAVLSSGSAAGPLTTLDDVGAENSLLLKTGAVLPVANAEGLQATAEIVLPCLDNDAWDAALGDLKSFWQDSPADTTPRILYVQGDVELSGDRQLYGIVFVSGKHIVFGDESCIHGVLYAPLATDVTIENTGASGRLFADGTIITGPGGIEITGNPVSVRLCEDYVDSFNIAAGAELDVSMFPGSWASP